jgi:hypothetical protein
MPMWKMVVVGCVVVVAFFDVNSCVDGYRFTCVLGSIDVVVVPLLARRGASACGSRRERATSLREWAGFRDRA